MGGHALKNYTTNRICRTQYDDLEDRVQFHIDFLFGSGAFRPIRFYHSKPDFGDMDFVLVTDRTNWKDRIIDHFGLDDSRYVSNGPVLSIGIDNFQIDVIHHSVDFADFAVCYYSFQDLGNLLGRIYHKLGMKLGHDGLWLVVRSPDSENRILDDILLTRDWDTVLDILGVDAYTYWNGFDTLEDIFEYVISSPWFDPDIFLLHNRNHTSRVRDRKRTTYNQFLNHIQGRSGSYQFETASSHGGHSIREPYYSQIVLDRFPWVEDRVSELLERDQFNTQFKTVYNGSIVMELTGLSGKELGHFMNQMEWTDELRQSVIDDPELVREMVLAKMGER